MEDLIKTLREVYKLTEEEIKIAVRMAERANHESM